VAKQKNPWSGYTVPRYKEIIAVVCALLLMPGEWAFAFGAQQSTPAAQPAESETAAALTPDQLDSLVAPIALYPDPLLAQVLAASTYPLEVVQLYQWLGKNKGLKDKALEDAVLKQDWDPSVQGLAPMPDVVKQLYDNIKWTTDLGNAFLAQQAGVMDAVQRMRTKAKDKGTLKTTEQQKVETKVVENKTVVVIEQANPQVVYVPSYDPVVVYGAPVYPYYPYVYPPGYVAAGMAISFGVGLAMGAAWGGGWGYGCGWGGGNNTININNNNNYNRNNINNGGNRNQINGGNRNQINGGGNRVNGGGNSWQHNPSHRGGAPYGDRGTANKYGGNARGDSVSNRQASARQNQGNRQQPGQTNRGGASASNRQQPGQTNRGGASASNRQQPSGGNRGSGGQDRVGNRSVPSGNSSRSSGGFGGGSGGYSGSSAKASSSRGSSSMSSRGGGGGSRGGGGGRRR
jgi:Protein of unknown function (DUF3300)